jgi:hypothetical protein
MNEPRKVNAYYIGSRRYETDGVIMIVSKDAVHTDCGEKCETLSDELLSTLKDRRAITLSIRALLETLRNFEDDNITLFVGEPKKPLILVGSKDLFAFIMPLNLPYTANDLPEPAQQATTPVKSVPAPVHEEEK